MFKAEVNTFLHSFSRALIKYLLNVQITNFDFVFMGKIKLFEFCVTFKFKNHCEESQNTRFFFTNSTDIIFNTIYNQFVSSQSILALTISFSILNFIFCISGLFVSVHLFDSCIVPQYALVVNRFVKKI